VMPVFNDGACAATNAWSPGCYLIT
jgi:hypothetical protein